MTTAIERILSTPLKATERGGMNSVRVAADSYHVATISAGMNDQAEYARLFAEAPALVQLLRELIDIEGPQPGNAEWHRKVVVALDRVSGKHPLVLP